MIDRVAYFLLKLVSIRNGHTHQRPCVFFLRFHVCARSILHLVFRILDVKLKEDVIMNYSDEYMNDLMVRMAHHSTAIEGNSLSLGETKSILIDGYIPRAMNMRELHEVMNYKAFMPFLKENVEQRTPLSLELIKSIHAILCKDAIESVPGQFKKIQNAVIGAEFTPTPPYMVPSALQDWMRNLETQLQYASNQHAKVEAICRQHIAFERIHPFPDGNGRVGRAMMVYSCMMEDMPPIVISVENRAEYINFLNTENVAGFAAYAAILQQREDERMQMNFTGKELSDQQR